MLSDAGAGRLMGTEPGAPAPREHCLAIAAYAGAERAARAASLGGRDSHGAHGGHDESRRSRRSQRARSHGSARADFRDHSGHWSELLSEGVPNTGPKAPPTPPQGGRTGDFQSKGEQAMYIELHLDACTARDED